ncbi:MAG: hypothetical protein ABSH50_30010 [Bryobacteraceae bacterium]|jgi:hypothetical protein
MDASLEPQPTLGRTFGSDWTIANIAKLLRFHAGQDFLRAGPHIGGLREISENYLRRTTARHLPTGVTVTFRRDRAGDWHAGILFAAVDHSWNDALAEEWLAALFMQDRPRVRDVTIGAPQPNTARYFKLTALGGM